MAGAERATALPATACQAELEYCRGAALRCMDDAMELDRRVREMEASGGRGEAVSAEAQPAAAPPGLVPLAALVEPRRRSGMQLRVRVRNDSEEAVDAFRFRVALFDGFNAPANSQRRRNGADRNVMIGTSSDPIEPGQTRDVGVWPLDDFPVATKGILTVTDVHFVDNTEWHGTATQEADPRAPREDQGLP